MAEAITAANFDDIINNSDRAVLVDFWASWCGPCRALGPVIEQVAEELSEKIVLYKCNVDDEAELAQRFQIVSIPTMMLFKGGKPVLLRFASGSLPVEGDDVGSSERLADVVRTLIRGLSEVVAELEANA